MSIGRRTFVASVATTVITGMLAGLPPRAWARGRFMAELDGVLAQTVPLIIWGIFIGAMVAIPVMLLRELRDLIEQKLNLTAGQKKKLAEIAGELLTDVKRIRPGAGQGKQQIAAALAQLEPGYLSKLQGVLDAGQLARWKEVFLQIQGARGLTSPQTARAIGLTNEQSRKVAQLVAAFDRGGPREIQGWLPALKLVGEKVQLDRAATAVLSKEQQSKLAALQGEPVEILTTGRFLKVAQNLATQLQAK